MLLESPAPEPPSDETVAAPREQVEHLMRNPRSRSARRSCKRWSRRSASSAVTSSSPTYRVPDDDTAGTVLMPDG
jgi:hypothetical protein